LLVSRFDEFTFPLVLKPIVRSNSTITRREVTATSVIREEHRFPSPATDGWLGRSLRAAALVLVPAKVVVEFVPWNEAGPDPARDRLEFPLADQSANLVLGALELGRNLADREGCGPVHARSIPDCSRELWLRVQLSAP
jgi:hypothetical protein